MLKNPPIIIIIIIIIIIYSFYQGKFIIIYIHYCYNKPYVWLINKWCQILNVICASDSHT